MVERNEFSPPNNKRTESRLVVNLSPTEVHGEVNLRPAGATTHDVRPTQCYTAAAAATKLLLLVRRRQPSAASHIDFSQPQPVYIHGQFSRRCARSSASFLPIKACTVNGIAAIVTLDSYAFGLSTCECGLRPINRHMTCS
jgi:hypothetical protein